MTCDEFQLQIYLLESGELSPEEKARLEDHLAQCPRCQSVFAVSQQIVENYTELPKPLVREDLRQRIRQTVSQERVVKNGFAGNYKTWLAIAASLLLVSTVIYRIYFYNPPPVPDIWSSEFISLNADSIAEQFVKEPDSEPKSNIQNFENNVQEISDKIKTLQEVKIDFSFSPGSDQKVKSIQAKINQLKQEPII